VNGVFRVVLLAAALVPAGAGALGPQWTPLDIGKVGASGTLDRHVGRFTVVAYGSDIWIAGDSFRFVYLPVRGNGAISAQVLELAPSHPWAKAGIMFREGLGPEARFAFLALTPAHGLHLFARTGDVEEVVHKTGPARAAPPLRIRLSRKGDTFRAYTSRDGLNWSHFASVDVPLSCSAYVGMAVSSHDNRKPCKTVFDEVEVTDEAVAGRITCWPAAQGRPARRTDIERKMEEMYRERLRERDDLSFPAGKKLVRLASEPPTARDLRGVLPGMQESPFDGVVIRLKAGRLCLRPFPYEESSLLDDYQELYSMEPGRISCNFLLLWATSPLDWFDDGQWRVALANTRMMAKAAVVGRCAGLLFDPECYGPSPWTWYDAPRRRDYPFERHRQKVRERGTEWIRAVQDVMPDPRILTLFMNGCDYLAYARHRSATEILDMQSREKEGMVAEYALLSSFMEGVLLGARGRAQVIDGNEPAYYYPLEGEHASYLRYSKERAAGAFYSGKATDRYGKFVRTGSTFYPNFIYGLYSPEWSGARRMSRAEQDNWLMHNVYWAVRTSDEFVWEYSEPPYSWMAGKMPRGYEENIRRARDQAVSGESPGFPLPRKLREAKREAGAL
jgi:hypothetical protein